MDKTKENTTETSKKLPMDFAELRNDTDFITKSTNLEKVSTIFSSQTIFSSHAKFNAFI